jgi:hypothetical protein
VVANPGAPFKTIADSSAIAVPGGRKPKDLVSSGFVWVLRREQNTKIMYFLPTAQFLKTGPSELKKLASFWSVVEGFS